MEFNKNFLEIAESYDHFLFDVWGVIHDGISAYPNTLKTITTLRDQGKKICFLSNAPRRARVVAEVLNNYGIHKNLYNFVMTSGEATYIDLSLNQNSNFNEYGQKYFYIGPEKDRDILNGLRYQEVQDAEDADFAIATGFNQPNSTLQEKMPQILSAKENNLPLICVNPDMIVVRKNGDEMICAGLIAQKYRELSGEVKYYGKPYQEIYRAVHNLLEKPEKSRILAIGDGLETDIKGANEFGIDSVLVTSGILSNKISVTYNQKADPEKVLEQCKAHGASPEYVIPNL